MSSESEQWSLEGELIRVSGEDNLVSALLALRLLSRSTSEFQLVRKGDWVRGGSETYVYEFRLSEAGIEPKEVLIKACVPFSPGQSLGSVLQSWIDRRVILSKAGVATPTLYGVGEGVLIEQFIPLDLTELLRQPGEHETLLIQLAEYAGVLSRLGFTPINPFGDLRSNGADVVVVDFGQDLGPPDVMSLPRPALFDQLRSYLSSLNLNLQLSKSEALEAAFVSKGGRLLN